MAGLTGSVCVVVIYKRSWFSKREQVVDLIVSWNRETAYHILRRWVEVKFGICAKNEEGLLFRLARDGYYGRFRWEFFNEQIKDY